MSIEELVCLSREERITHVRDRFEEFRARKESKRPRYPEELQKLACALVTDDELTPWKAAKHVGVSLITLQGWVTTHTTPELRELRVIPDLQTAQPLSSPFPMSCDSLSHSNGEREWRSASSIVLEMRNGVRLIVEGNYAERVLTYALAEVTKNA